MIPAILIEKFGPLGAKLVFFGTLLLAVIAILSLAYCQGRSDGKTGEVVKQQKREIKVQKDIGTANEKAAGTRVDDATKAVRQEKELSDALKATQDPDRQRALRGCIILQQQGRDTSSLPACR